MEEFFICSAKKRLKKTSDCADSYIGISQSGSSDKLPGNFQSSVPLPNIISQTSQRNCGRSDKN